MTATTTYIYTPLVSDTAKQVESFKDKRLISLEAAGVIVGLSKATVYRWCKYGKQVDGGCLKLATLGKGRYRRTTEFAVVNYLSATTTKTVKTKATRRASRELSVCPRRTHQNLNERLGI